MTMEQIQNVRKRYIELAINKWTKQERDSKAKMTDVRNNFWLTLPKPTINEKSHDISILSDWGVKPIYDSLCDWGWERDKKI